MKKHCTGILFLFFLIIAFLPFCGNAQNIDGDTIYINTYVEAQVTFPSEVDDARFIPIDTYKEIQFPIQGAYILLHSKVENSKKAILIIKEGGREHRFLVVYKKNINQYDSREYTYNYKTLKLLKKHLEEAGARNAKVTVAAEQKNQSPKTKKNDNKIMPEKPVEAAPDYYAVLEQGNEAFKKEAYDEAIAIYEKAKLLKPEDDIAQIKIDQTRAKLSEIAKQEQLENEKKFTALKAEAKSYLDQRKYEKAKEAFEKAKYIMPGDGYAIRQIENIDKLIAQEAAQKKLQDQLNQYNAYIREGDKALSEKKLAEAETAFKNALTIKEFDKVALSKLKIIDEQNQQKAFLDELEAKYTAALSVADKLFKAADYNNAITEYNNALRIFPRSYPKDKIKTVSKIISDRIKEVNRVLADQRTQENERRRILALQKDTTDRYNASIAKGDIELKKNNLLLAKNFYKQAAALKPLETLPVTQMDLIEIKLGQIAFEKRKREDSTRQAREVDKNYELALTQAKSYTSKQEWLQAKIAYEAASDLKPMKEEPKKQLEIVKNKLAEIQKQLELDNRFDSLNALGDSLLILKEFDMALLNYNAASQIKPASKYPLNQVRYIKSEKKHLAELEVIRIKNEEAQKLWEAAEKKYQDELRYRAARKRGDSAVAAKNWPVAIKAFKEALEVHPDNKYVQDRLRPVQYQYDLQRLAEEKLAEQKLAEEKAAKETKKKGKRKKNKEEAPKE
ncbi:MAG: hypothetical protein JWP81_3411 [Ferruginibacter sp.]|nr:hypothetical protein [Ferruginibacter sp.]